MNKNFMVSKLSLGLSLITSIVGSAFYLGAITSESGAYNLLDGREAVVDVIFKAHRPDIMIAYSLFGTTLILACLSIYFAYLGYKEGK